MRTAGAGPGVGLAQPTSPTRLITTIATHGVVDFFSFIVVPLLSVLEGRLSLSHTQGAVLLAAGSVSSGLIQPLTAVLTDRFDTRWFGTLGFLIAVVAVSLVGYAQSFEQLLLLQVLGAAGIGAFHPVAAAAVGQLSGARRSLGVSWFYAAGMIGGVGGNLVAPVWVERFGGGSAELGLRSLAWLAIPGIVFVGFLAAAIHSVPHRHHAAAVEHRELPREERRSRWSAVWLLYAGNVLRFMVDTCVITLIVRWTEQQALSRVGAAVLDEAVRADASRLNGPLQAAKQVGMGVGGLALGFFLARRHEKAALIVIPLFGAVAVALLPRTGGMGGGWTALLVCTLAGVGYAAVMPITISLAQRLLPHRTSLASSLMMGGAWSVAALGPPLAQWMHDRFGLETAFVVTGGFLVVAAALAVPLRSSFFTRT
jgi:MFS transporter, FSR family, fosmidomycin resistance protein